MKPLIGVIGCDGNIPKKLRDMSEKIGMDVAKSGSLLVCGGRGGIMEAVCRGVKRAGGTTIGILPSLDKKDANSYVDIPITTGIGIARNALVVSSSDVVIAINGRVGTLSEISLALNYGKPVVVVRNSGGVSDSIEEGLRKAGILQKVYPANADNAVKVALDLID